MPRSQVVERYFMEHRAKLIDVAAFLDRLDRAADDGPRDDRSEDYRVVALRRALDVVAGHGPDRARRVLELLSDPTGDPIASAAGLKGAFGAWPGDDGA